MSNVGKTEPFDPSLWSSIFDMLSLDLVQPYVADMRLQLPLQPEFMRGLRNLMTEAEFDDLSSVVRVFGWIRNTYERGFEEHLRNWGESVYAYANRPDVFLWSSILRIRQPGVELDLDTGPVFIRLVRRRLVQRSDLHITNTAPATSWDRNLYQTKGYDESSNPLHQVSNIHTHINFVESWEEARQIAEGKVDMEDVEWWAIQQAESMGMPVERLGRPGPWPRPPSPWR